MLDWTLFMSILADGKPSIPNLVHSTSEDLFDEGLSMGTLYIGKQGTGKTSSLARHLVEYMQRHPDRAIFVLDWSGSITDNILNLVNNSPDKNHLIKRIVYDDMGNSEWITPLPEFSQEYGDHEDQVQRVTGNLVRIAPELVKNAPILGGISLQGIGPEIFRVITAITNKLNDSWQITETKRLIRDESLLRLALKRYGYKVPSTKWWLENTFLQIKPSERELRTYSLVSLLGAIEPKEVRARIGYNRPAWTPKEAIQNGLMVLCDGAKLINKGNTQHYLFMQVYSLILQEINKRRPSDPKDLPVSIVLDEVYSLLSIPGMAEDISKLAPQYRSRKLQIYIVLQELAQLSEELRPHIWSLGNIVCFGMSNMNEAYEIAQQLFEYIPGFIKMRAAIPGRNPILEPDRGQYLQLANWIQGLDHRQCIARLYENERTRFRYINYIAKTKNTPNIKSDLSLYELKEMLLRKRGLSIQDSLRTINERNLVVERSKPPQVL